VSISKQKINFGTDGWRGIIAEDFTFENLGKLSLRIAKSLNGGEKVCIGYDNRFLSPEYASFIAGILHRQGIEVDLSDCPVPTPCVSHRVKSVDAEMGIAVSASHNPHVYNGVKIKENYGGSASEEFVSRIIKDLNGDDYTGETWNVRFRGEKNSWKEKYIEHFLKVLPADNLKVVCDYFYGSGYPFFHEILAEKGYGHVMLKHGRDPFFNGIHPEPKPEFLQELTDTVLETGADVGFAFDGDADRIAVVDEKGRFLSSQIVLAVLAHDMLQSGKKGRIVKTVAGTYLVDRMSEKFGVELKVVPIGFKNICPEMLSGDVMIAGEESGGFGFGDYLPERDSIHTAVRILEMMSRRQKKPGEIWDEVKEKFGDSVYLRNDFKIEKKLDKTEIINNVDRRLKEISMPFKVKGVMKLDGIRINMEGGNWLLIRPSGTEPLIRVYAETDSSQSTENLLNKGRELVK